MLPPSIKNPSQKIPSFPALACLISYIVTHKTPLIILLLSLFVGVIAGLLSTFFDLAIDAIMHFRDKEMRQNVSSPLLTAIGVISSSAVFCALGFYLVMRFAPETKGSGIPDIEGALDEISPVRWWRVIPIKFIAGIATVSSGLVLGREGPSVQMGGNTGAMSCALFKQKSSEIRLTLIASGSAAGLAAAFNAPIAGMMFVIEEMRPEFKYNLISIKAVMIASIMATVVYRSIQGQAPMIELPVTHNAPLYSLFLFLILGGLFGGLGVIFNALVIALMGGFERLHQNKITRFIALGGVFGAVFGVILIFFPSISGSGASLIPEAVNEEMSLSMLFLLFFLRAGTTLLCFSSGAPGGVFAPMLALGALFGACFGTLCTSFFPSLEISIGMFAISGMSALFAATVRAPVTGILLIIELTQEYTLILPLMITVLGATITAQALGGQPLYSLLLARSIEKEQKKAALTTEK